jgi:hypothetical protein
MINESSLLEQDMLFKEDLKKVMKHIINYKSDNSIMMQTEYAYRCGIYDMYHAVLDAYQITYKGEII